MEEEDRTLTMVIPGFLMPALREGRLLLVDEDDNRVGWPIIIKEES